MKIKFFNANIITVDENFTVYSGGELVVTDNIITFVGKKCPDNVKYDQIINCNGNILMPGLINGHSHAAMTLFRGTADHSNFNEWWEKYILPREKNLTLSDIYNGCCLAIKEMQSNGITTFFDCYFNYEQTIKAANQLGMRVGIGFGAIAGNDIITLKNLEKEYNFLKTQQNVFSFLYAHSTYSCDEFQFATLLEMAKKHQLVFSTHVSETLSEVGLCHNKHGLTPVGLLESYGMFDVPCVLAHCVYCDKDDVDILKKYDVTICHNPCSNLKLGSGVAPIYSFVKNNLNVALGTDGAASNNSLDILKEMYVAAMLQSGVLNNPNAFEARQLIEMATVNGAKAFKINNLGRLKVSYLADIIMLDNNAANMQPQNNLISNIAFSASSKNVLLTMINGKIVYNTYC